MIGEMVVYGNGPNTRSSVGIVLRSRKRPCDGLAEEPEYWLECLWDDGEIDGVFSRDISFIKREKTLDKS